MQIDQSLKFVCSEVDRTLDEGTLVSSVTRKLNKILPIFSKVAKIYTSN
jgi:hypothetical protein